ncbi:MAG: adenosine deaminase [Actinomycetia bacterium]|nr:adenosine deaminase [Actinomycetes bacterium]
MTQRTNIDDARGLPKSLLHDHLDGGLRVATVLELADEIGWTLPTTDPTALQAWFTAGAASKDLLQYLATFEHTLAVMQTEAHIERIAAEAALDLANDGVVYAEVRFAPELHVHNGLTMAAVVSAVTAGFRRGEREAAAAGKSILVNAICCAMRTEQRSLEVVQLVERMRDYDDKVVAFDLAGAETGWPPSLHAEALAFARQHHINITIHASEPPDLELIDDALQHGAHRIGHGVRLRSDITTRTDGSLQLGPLARYVYDHQIPLEMAPTCHVHVGAVPDLASHPIGPMLRHGFNVSVNTDNRLMSGVMPSTELLAVATTFDLTMAEVEQLVVNGVMAGFAPLEVRKQIIDQQVRPAFATA